MDVFSRASSQAFLIFLRNSPAPFSHVRNEMIQWPEYSILAPSNLSLLSWQKNVLPFEHKEQYVIQPFFIAVHSRWLLLLKATAWLGSNSRYKDTIQRPPEREKHYTYSLLFSASIVASANFVFGRESYGGCSILMNFLIQILNPVYELCWNNLHDVQEVNCREQIIVGWFSSWLPL